MKPPPPVPTDPVRPRIGLWGRFDAPRFEDLVQPWILEHEIRRRLPEAVVQTYAPLEREGSVARDGGFPVADLGDWSQNRVKELSQALDCAIVAGDVFGVPEGWSSSRSDAGAGKARLSPFLVEGLGPKLERLCPVTWSAVGVAFELEPEEAGRIRKALASRPYVSVRDEASRDRLRRAGVGTYVAVVPDPLLLLPRAFPQDLLARRVGYLRHMEWFPPSGAPLVVQGSRAFGDRAEAFGEALATALERLQVPVVLLELDCGRGETEFLDAVSQHLSVPTFRLPPEAGSSDLVAALSHARAFVGTSSRASVACSAFGVPSLLMESLLAPRAGGRKRVSAGEIVLALRRLLETPRGKGVDPGAESKLAVHFDRLAGIAQSAVAGRLRRRSDGTEAVLARLRENDRVLESWRKAYSARTQQVVDQRLAFTALIESGQAETQRLAAQIATVRESLAAIEDNRAAAAAELAAERSQRESIESLLSSEREISHRVAAERNDLARALDDLHSQRARIEGELAESKPRAEREMGDLRRMMEAAAEQASRREKRAAEDLLDLRTELDRTHERLEKARSDYSELRVSHTLLFAEVAEVRADAGRFSSRQHEMREAAAESERERDRALAELSRLEAERARARQEIEDLQAELDRLSARSPQQIPTSLKIRVRQMLASSAGEPRGQT